MLDSFKNMVLLVILMILLVQGIVLFMVENYPKSALVTDEVEEKLSH